MFPYAFPLVLYVGWILVFLATHISLCFVVYKDAKELERTALYISPLLWSGISFSLPILGMFIYWIMNYSILVRYRKIDHRN